MIKLYYPFKLISKDNEKVFNRQGRPFLSKKYKDFANLIAIVTKNQYKQSPLTGDLQVIILAHFRDKRHCDCSNLSKGLLDAIQKIVYVNDRQIKAQLTIISSEHAQEDYFVVAVDSIKGLPDEKNI